MSHGKLSLKQDGSFRYTPSPGYVGDDFVTYRAIIAQASSTGSTARYRRQRDFDRPEYWRSDSARRGHGYDSCEAVAATAATRPSE